MQRKVVINSGTLVDYSDVILDWNVASAEVIQTAELFRAATIENHDRGNLRVVVSFTLKKTHANIETAIEWQLKTPQTYAGKQNVVIYYKSYAGTEVTRYLTGAAVEISTPEILGVTTFADVRLIGPQITDS